MFNLFKIFLSPAEPKQFLGALLDDRQPAEKQDDVHFFEIVATANPVNWTTKATYRTFPVLDQNQSYTCGANALSKSEGVSFAQKYGAYLQLSRADIYQRRMNRPQAGMTLYDMFDIASQGVTLEQFVSSKLYNDADYDSAVIESWMKDVAKTFSINGGVYLESDIDTIASVIQTTGKGVILLTYFLSSEWSRNIPVITNRLLGRNDPSSLRHFVVAVDFTMINGVKYLVIEDSTHFGGLSQRLVSEDWVLNRVAGAGYPMNFKFVPGTGNKPTYNGATIVSAQECLKFEGVFPQNVATVENIGPTTRKALATFQTKYGLPVTQALDLATKNKLHQLYP